MPRLLHAALALALVSACDRPRVYQRPDDDAAVGADVVTGIDIDSARALLTTLASMHGNATVEEISALYSPNANMLEWRGRSSWRWTRRTWAERVSSAKVKRDLAAVYLLEYGRTIRVIANFQESTAAGNRFVLSLFDFEQAAPGEWRISFEAEIDAIVSDGIPPYSTPVLGDFSYRAPPEIAVLRSHSGDSGDLAWLQSTECPSEPCEALMVVDLMLITPTGDLVYSDVLSQVRGPCRDIERFDLAGAVRVYERDALVVERTAPPCRGDADESRGAVAIVGVRGRALRRLVTVNYARIDAVNHSSVTIRYQPPGQKLRTVTLVPKKQENRLVFQPE